MSNKIKEYNKLRFSSNVDLPLNKLIEFRMLTIVIKCVIEKDNKHYPEIYLDKCLYEQDDYFKEFMCEATSSKNV